MSYVFTAYYACVQLPEALSESGLRLMIFDLARSLVDKYRIVNEFPSHLEETFEDLNNGTFDEQAAIKEIADTIWLYIDEIVYGESETSFVVRSETDSDYWDDEIVDESVRHYFEQTGRPFLLLNHSSFNGYTASSSQSVCYRHNNVVVVESTTKYFEEALSS